MQCLRQVSEATVDDLKALNEIAKRKVAIWQVQAARIPRRKTLDLLRNARCS